MNIADIIMYSKQVISNEDRDNVIASLRNVNGVIAPRFSPGKEKLLVVAYNPDKVKSNSIQKAVNDMGIRTVIVGM